MSLIAKNEAAVDCPFEKIQQNIVNIIDSFSRGSIALENVKK